MDGLGGPAIQAAIAKQKRVREIFEDLPNLPPDKILKAIEAAKKLNKSAINLLENGISQ